MRTRALALCACAVLLCGDAQAERGKGKNDRDLDPPTQALEVPKEPPAAVVADSTRLVFHVAPLSAKGLLTQQVKDGLNALLRLNRGAQLVRIRAFVAGSGDLRRVPAIVSDMFTDKRLPLPAVTAVQVGSLPLDGAQVLLESVALERKPVSPNGLAFVSGQVGVAKSAAEPVLKALAEAKLPASAVRRLTCFLNSLEHIGDAQSSIAAAFPSVPASFVQLRRDSTGDFIECESVASLESPPSDSPQLLGSIKGRYSQVAVVGPGLLVLTGVQLGFGAEASDIRLAFERLKRTLEGIRASPDTVVFSNIYPLSNGAAEQIRKTRLEFWNADRPPASTLLLFEGLSSPDATFGIEAVAVPRPR